MTAVIVGTARPRLARHVRMVLDPTRQQHVLQLPETVVVLRGSGAAILELCDGTRTVAEVVAQLRERYGEIPEDEVHRFLAGLAARRCVVLAGG